MDNPIIVALDLPAKDRLQLVELIKIMESHSNLKTLCGFSGDETELDLSKKDLTAGCGVLVSNEIKNNRALAKLDISNNYIPSDQQANLKGICTSKSINLTL